MIRTRFLRLGTIAVLAGAVPACGSSTDGENVEANGIDPILGVAMQGLGDAVADCNDESDVGADGNFDSAAKTMTVRLTGGGSTVFSVIGNAVTINGWSCYDNAGVALTTTNVRKMNITTDVAADDKLVFDLLPGSFGSIFSASGGVTVDMRKDGDTIAVRGSTAANKMKAGESGSSLYLEVSGDNNADIKVSGTGSPDTSDNITFLLGDGNDTFTGTGGTVTANHIDGVTSLGPVTLTSLVLYGGEGNDTLQGGDYNDTLYGGAGDDTFLTAEDDDGDDNYHGGADTDTMSYADRTVSVTADINPGTKTATGTVDLWSLTYPVAADVDLTVNVDGAGDRTIELDGMKTPAAVVAKINTDTAYNGTDGGTAYLNSMNQVVLQHPTDDFVVTATGGGATLLGVAAATFTGLDADDGEGSEADDIMSDVENLIGGTADDTLIGSAVSNNIEGGDGADTISGGIKGTCGSDADVLEGDDGDDTFRMGPLENCGDDVKGGAGTDTVDYQYRAASLTITINSTANDGDGAAAENDNIRTDVESVIGGTLNDTITGGSGSETLRGGPGDDTINGGSGDDTLIGNSGNDTLNGDAGDDMFECAGDDSVFVGLRSWEDDKGDGDDIMNGGTGTDKINYKDRTTVVSVAMCTDSSVTSGNATSTDSQCTDSDGGPGIARLFGTTDMSGGIADTKTVSIDTGGGAEAIVFTGATTAALIASQITTGVTDANFLAVAEADGSITLSLTDTDLLNSVITVTGADQDELGFVSTVNDTVTGAREADKVVNAEWIVGGDQDDTLTGHTADEIIEGGDGADTISGGDGNDSLYGDDGADTVSGDAGDDLVNGGGGTDALNGGAGDGDVCTVLATDSDTTDGTCEVL